MRLIRPDGIAVFVEYIAPANYVPGRHVLILSDTMRQKHAESLAAESARSEAEALRRAALALTQNLSMDAILDTLLACLADVVPYDSACILFVENDLQLLVARERPRRLRRMEAFVLDSSQHSVLRKILVEKRGFHVKDTNNEPSWTGSRILAEARCWMGVPLIAGYETVGILSIAASSADAFSSEHFRKAKSLAIPAAVGIQNARTQERAAIYASELEVQLKELHKAQRALQEARADTPRA
jgi:transcriptional regulator with GAF, ATPase, and Fis domain